MPYVPLLLLTAWLLIGTSPWSGPAAAVQVEASCPVAGVYDQRCIEEALRTAQGQAASRLQLGCHTYTFTAPLRLAHAKGVDLAGSGACTRLTYTALGYQGATLIEVTDSQGIALHDIAIAAPVEPEVVTIADLPAAGPFTAARYIAIDRGSHHPYVPTINDQDIVPVGVGGRCTSHCISKAELDAAYDLQVLVADSQNVDLYGLQGQNVSITLRHVVHAKIHDNAFTGGGKINSWGLIAVVPGTGPSMDIAISNNRLQQASFSGVSLRDAQGVTLDHNVAIYNGESGFKIGQGTDGYVSGLTSTANDSEYNHYDGFDYSEDVYSGKTVTFHTCNCTSTDDRAIQNDGTGFITNGAGFTFTRPIASHNQDAGMDAMLDDSVISSGTFTDNNLGHRNANQVTLDQPDAPRFGAVQFFNNTVNVTAKGGPGYGIYVTDGRRTTLQGNTVNGAKIWDASHNTVELQDTDADGPRNHKR